MFAILRIYGQCLARTPQALLKAPWMVLVPPLYVAVLTTAAGLLSPLGIIGSFIVGFISAALIASFLYGVSELVGGHKLLPAELASGTRSLFSPVMGVLFVVWIASVVVGLATTNMPNGAALVTALDGVMFVLLNATPEAIYLKRAFTGMEVLSGAFGFMQEHWIEWLIPNVLLLVFYYFGVPWLMLFVPGGIAGLLVGSVVWGILLVPVFVFRGLLFSALDGRMRGSSPWATRR